MAFPWVARLATRPAIARETSRAVVATVTKRQLYPTARIPASNQLLVNSQHYSAQLESSWKPTYIRSGQWIAAARVGQTAAALRAMTVKAPPAEHRPKLVAFDLDATLWYPEMYMLDGPPFKLSSCGKAVIDAAGERTRLMGDTPAILRSLATDATWGGTEVAYVSRTDQPRWAATHLRLFKVDDDIDMHSLAHHHEIYPGSKVTHFKRIHERSKIDFRDMVFFDDDSWNIREVSQLGVVCVHTPRGLTYAAFQEGLRRYAERKKHALARR